MNRAYALLASLILIATPMTGCLSGEDLVDDILGCVDENAANYDENATAELLGDCIYIASMDSFMTAMEEEMGIDALIEENGRLREKLARMEERLLINAKKRVTRKRNSEQ